MGRRKPETVIILCGVNFLAGRCAEALFSSVVARMGLPWIASARTLITEGTPKKLGRLSPTATSAVTAMRLPITDELTRPPVPLTADDLEKADRIVAMNQVEHLPLLQARFPAWANKVEYWEIDDSPESLACIEHEVMDLTARLIRGGERQKAPPPERCPKCVQLVELCTCRAKTQPARNITVRVGRETKGRRGKGVTTVSDLPLNESDLAKLAATLKQRLGTGGTAKEGRIEIQGDHRDRVMTELERLGYRVKRSGG